MKNKFNPNHAILSERKKDKLIASEDGKELVLFCKKCGKWIWENAFLEYKSCICGGYEMSTLKLDKNGHYKEAESFNENI